MARTDMIAPMAPTQTLPVVRKIEFADLRAVLSKGVRDFKAMPTHVLFLSIIYPIVGLLLARVAFGYDVIPLLYPLAAGFALIGPVAAIGLYELSRRRELGLDTSWVHAFDVFRSPSLPAIALLGGLLLLIFIVWVAISDHLYVRAFGYAEPKSLWLFLQEVLTTPKGHYLIIVGNAVGLIFAVFVFQISVVSFPLLLDRNVSAAVAIVTSIRSVMHNPLVMAVWGLIIAAALLIGFLPMFFGLAVVMPILGHATWHLYRKVVEPDSNPRPSYRPRPQPIRYGAQFPSSLFFSSRDLDEANDEKKQ